MKTTDCEGNEIEIATLEEDEGCFVKVANELDFGLLVKSMGWETVEQFEKETGGKREELIGRFWLTSHNRIYLPVEQIRRTK